MPLLQRDLQRCNVARKIPYRKTQGTYRKISPLDLLSFTEGRSITIVGNKYEVARVVVIGQKYFANTTSEQFKRKNQLLIICCRRNLLLSGM